MQNKINLLKQLRDRALTDAKLNKDNAEVKLYYTAIANTYDMAILVLTDNEYADKVYDILNEEK